MGCKISLVGENRILKNKIVLNLKLDFVTPIRVAVGISLVVQWAESLRSQCRGPGFDPWLGN